MSLNAFPFARISRVALAAACASLSWPAQSALAQAENPSLPATNAAPATQPGAIIKRIVVAGTQRIEPATVLTYVSVKEGDVYDPEAADRSLKTLFATGLFADVKFN